MLKPDRPIWNWLVSQGALGALLLAIWAIGGTVLGALLAIAYHLPK